MKNFIVTFILIACCLESRSQQHMPEVVLKGRVPVIKVSIRNLMYFFHETPDAFKRSMSAYSYKRSPISPGNYEKKIGNKTYAIWKSKQTVWFSCPGKDDMIATLEKFLMPYLKNMATGLTKRPTPNSDGSYDVSEIQKVPVVIYGYKSKGHAFHIVIRHSNEPDGGQYLVDMTEDRK